MLMPNPDSIAWETLSCILIGDARTFLALPFIMEKTAFCGRVYVTPPIRDYGVALCRLYSRAGNAGHAAHAVHNEGPLADGGALLARGDGDMTSGRVTTLQKV